MPTNTKLSDRCAAFAAEALMIRKLHAYRAYRDIAENRGADVTADPDTPSFAAMTDRYVALLDDWVTETPDTTTAIIAYLDLVADIMAGELEARRSDEAAAPASTERDFSFATELLTSVRRVLNDQNISEAIMEERARFATGKGPHPAIAKLDETELAALIVDYRRLNQRANKEGISDKERDRLCNELRLARDKVSEYHPLTLRGVLMVLDLGALIDDPHWWPEMAIESLRKMVEMAEAQP